jgi:hypothetical protein
MWHSSVTSVAMKANIELPKSFGGKRLLQILRQRDVLPEPVAASLSYAFDLLIELYMAWTSVLKRLLKQLIKQRRHSGLLIRFRILELQSVFGGILWPGLYKSAQFETGVGGCFDARSFPNCFVNE